MPIDPKNLYLRGRCDIRVGSGYHESVDCHLNLETQSLDCFDKRQAFDRDKDDILVTNLELSSPLGILRAKEVQVAFIKSQSRAGFSSTETYLSNIFALNTHTGHCSCVINNDISFIVAGGSISESERMFFPGTDLAFPVKSDCGATIIGNPEYTSLKDSITVMDAARLAISVAIGAPAREFARIEGNRLTLYLNNHGYKVRARPLIFMGWPYRSLDTAKAATAEIFYAAQSYILTLETNERKSFTDATISYLQARTISGSYEVAMLAAFHFLEWLDNSRTMSKNSVSVALGVNAEEANLVCVVRNNLAHNRGGLRNVIEDASKGLKMCAPVSRAKLLEGNAATGFMNYLMTGLGCALLGKIGYNSPAAPFLPPFEEFVWSPVGET